jgi:predicted  nucleic acid-binding Zn-ribbon protein
MLVWNTDDNYQLNLVAFLALRQKLSQMMEQISAEINQLNTKIDAIEALLKNNFKDWSEEETNLYGIEEQEARKQLRKKEEQLREERKQLREQQTILLRNKEKTNAGGILGIIFLT